MSVTSCGAPGPRRPQAAPPDSARPEGVSPCPQVQGMSFIAAVLILNMDTAADAFVAFANLLNRPCQLAFFRVDHSLVRARLSSL